MKQTYNEAEKERLKLNEQMLSLETGRDNLVIEKKKFAMRGIEIDNEIKEYNKKINELKLKVQSVNLNIRVMDHRFDERKVEKILHQISFIIRDIIRRGISLGTSEKQLLSDIDNLLK